MLPNFQGCRQEKHHFNVFQWKSKSCRNLLEMIHCSCKHPGPAIITSSPFYPLHKDYLHFECRRVEQHYTACLSASQVRMDDTKTQPNYSMAALSRSLVVLNPLKTVGHPCASPPESPLCRRAQRKKALTERAGKV